jgi:hypothetical protein
MTPWIDKPFKITPSDGCFSWWIPRLACLKMASLRLTGLWRSKIRSFDEPLFCRCGLHFTEVLSCRWERHSVSVLYWIADLCAVSGTFQLAFLRAQWLFSSSGIFTLHDCIGEIQNSWGCSLRNELLWQAEVYSPFENTFFFARFNKFRFVQSKKLIERRKSM